MDRRSTALLLLLAFLHGSGPAEGAPEPDVVRATQEEAAMQAAAPTQPATDAADDNNTALFSISEKFQKIKDSVKGLYSSAFNSSQDATNQILGAVCKVNEECKLVSNSSCDRGTCLCNENYTSASSPDRCLRIVKLGEECEEEIQCSKGQKGATCIVNRCRCSADFTETNGVCAPNSKLGSPCKGNSDCRQIPLSECIDSFCSCAKPYISSTYSNSCLIIASPAQPAPCQESLQCVTQYGDRSRCSAGFCECEPEFHAYNGKCTPDLKLGESCNKSIDCVVSKQLEEETLRECYNSTCVCPMGYSSSIEENHCVKGNGYQLHASLAWLLCIFLIPYMY